MLEGINNLTANDVDNFVANNDGIIVFHKTLCPMCKVMGKVLLKTQEEDSSINIASIDSEADAPLLEKFGVDRVPSLVVVKGGEVKASHTGTLKPHEVIDFYNKA